MKDIDFKKGEGLVPAIVQDHLSGKVLMLGYMNEEAVTKTKETGQVTFYSRSKGRLWVKGEESGNFLDLVSLAVDCDNDTLLIKAIPHGPVCHTGADTCFNEDNSTTTNFLDHLESIIADRIKNPNEKSYTAALMAKGINKVAQKVGEEAVEMVIEAKDDDKELFLNEAADLLFHYMVLLQAKGFKLQDVIKVLMKRHK